MDNSISSFVTKLITKINTDRDGLLLIDGRWGTGKTYFIKHKLKDYYDPHPFFYISLMGVGSLSDFKSKIIECYYLAGTDNLKNEFNSITDGISLLQGKADNSGVIKSLISSIGSSVKGKVLSSLSGVFILDDLERVNDLELTSSILNYCHTLYSQRDERPLDFIIVGNTSKESSFDIKHKEKIISDTITYQLSRLDLLEIISPKLSSLPEKDKDFFLNIINHQDLVNIRIVNRCIEKFKPIYEYANKNPSKSWAYHSVDILGCISASIILHHLLNKSLEEIRTHPPENYFLDDKEDMPIIEKNLWDLYRKYAIPNMVRDYSMGLETITSIQEIIFSEIITMTVEIAAVALEPHLCDVDETLLQEYLYDAISRNIPLPLDTWLKIVKNYISLTNNDYLISHPLISATFIEVKANEFSIDEIIAFIDSNGGMAYCRNYGPLSINSNSHMNLLIKKFESHFINQKINKLRNAIANDGWHSINIAESIDNIDDLSKYRPLEIIGSSLLIKHIITTWKILDIEAFDYYLKNLYNFSNIKTYLSGEKPHLKRLQHYLSVYLKSGTPNFRHGAIKRLNNVIEEILARL